MTKNILLAATAVGAIAFAGSASAIDITSSTVSGVSATNGLGTNAYRLATQSVVGTGIATTGTTSVISALSTTSGLAVGTYVLRFDYTGIAGFTATPTLALGAPLGCTVASSLSTGGGTAQNFVEFAVTVSGATCTTNPIFTLTAPFNQTSLSAVTAKSGLTLNGVSIDNSSSAVARTIVQLGSGYLASISGAVDSNNSASLVPDSPVIDNADFPTRLAVGTGATPYVAFTSGAAFDNIIGALGYVAVASTYLDLSGTAGKLTTNVANTPNIDVTVNGAFQNVNVRLTTADDNTTGLLSPTSSNATTAQFTGIAGTRYNVVLLSAGATTTQIGGGNYNAAFSSVANSNLNAPIQVGQTGLETVQLEGTNFLAPWLTMQSANYNSIVRISNNGGTATGPITLTLRSNNGGTVNVNCQLTSAMLSAGTLVGGGIAQNAAIEFSGRTLANQCFGTTSTNADLQVTIQASSLNLAAKVRIINPDSSVSESQLGFLNNLGGSF